MRTVSPVKLSADSLSATAIRTSYTLPVAWSSESGSRRAIHWKASGFMNCEHRSTPLLSGSGK
jgi:hypothetical protein